MLANLRVSEFLSFFSDSWYASFWFRKVSAFAPAVFLSSPCQAWHEDGMRQVARSAEFSRHWETRRRKGAWGQGQWSPRQACLYGLC